MSEKLRARAILVIEPFYGGSHKQLIDDLLNYFSNSPEISTLDLVKLPAKKWHWRARTSALYFSELISQTQNYDILFCSDVLPLSELLGLRSDLNRTLKILYFHENQLVYPVQNHKARDFQYGYNQILSALSADVVLFNSNFNKDSFLNNIDKFFKLQPDFRPKKLKEKIKPKCKVVYFPINVMKSDLKYCKKSDVLHIIWPHRWEHDKNPEEFFDVLFRLVDNNYKFVVSVLGEAYSEVPKIFYEAKKKISNNILHWGRMESKEDFYNCLRTAHVAVSTAKHEFFGVAMLEAVSCNCFPLVCNRLVYPEIYPKFCLYNTTNQLYKKLKNFCEKPYLTQVYLEQENRCIEGFFNLRNLIEELENSFRLSYEIDNKLLLKCVLLEAENQNLKRSHWDRKIKLNNVLCKSDWDVSKGNKANETDKKYESESELNESFRIFGQMSYENMKDCSVGGKSDCEVVKLQETVTDLQRRLKERERTIELLCEKYLYLKNNKNKMEIDLKKKICRLERLLNVTCEIQQEVHREVETKIEKYLSEKRNIFEALFLQEKWRSNRLMYENVRLHHEIKRLEEDGGKSQNLEPVRDEKTFCQVLHHSIDKCTSEPVMRIT